MSDIAEAVAKAITQAIDESERVQLLTRDEMMGNASLHNKWLNDVINRLAERKP